jgi:hypothetical protein
MDIHLNRNGIELGSFTLDAVTAGLAAGNILSSDLAWYEGAPDWQPLSATLTSLFRLPVAATPIGTQSTAAKQQPESAFRALLAEYLDQTIAVNWKEPKKYHAAKLVSANHEFFTIFAADASLTIHYPYHQIAHVLQAKGGVSVPGFFGSKQYPIAIEVMQLIVYSGGVGVSFPI